ncbi:C1 family peptidase [uncultured Desulfosarcina sp.]|uniref:C1 family peptidase n=1 Tax=uncultured Desulfosarcina sp. TaxID=218289 RepID=UPI0029C91174|nr:C1 family peptidase [uncultured Desulfosarcina sp.]
MPHPKWKTCVIVICLLLAGGPATAGELSEQEGQNKQIESMRLDIERAGYGFQVDAEALAAGGRENLNGYISPPEAEKESYMSSSIAAAEAVAEATALELPKRWNWMDHDGVTAIKNQRPAGTCWAFSTVAPLECNILIHDGVEEDISEQYLVSCNNDGLGCNTGGWAVHKYFSSIPPGEAACDGESGAVLEEDFPYQCGEDAYTPDCAGSTREPLPRPYVIEGFAYVDETVATIKEAIFKYGPISASVAVDPYFSAYAGGVFNRDYDSFTNHAISLVGWDDTQGENGVWYLRNSWSDEWGEDGYMRIEYNCSRVGEDPAYVVYSGGVMSSNGLVALDDEGYSCSATVGIVLRDSDLADDGVCDVVLATDGGDAETVTLSQTDGTGNFWWSVATVEGIGNPGDGVLQVASGETVTASYVDADDGRGSTDVTKTYTAYIDCLSPDFDGLASAEGENGYVGLAWSEADDPHGPIKYNVYRNDTREDSVGGLIATTTETEYRDYTVDPGQTYFYVVRALDGLGNEEDNRQTHSAAALAAFNLQRASVHGDGTEADGRSAYPAVSADGRYVVFESSATNLVDDDTNGRKDIFVYDRETASVEIVSLASDGTRADANSGNPCISGNGRYVAFESTATNLVGDDANGRKDIFVYDRETASVEIASLASDGTQGTGSSAAPGISGDGRYVAFHSFAADLVEDDTNGTADVFVHDRQTGLTVRVSITDDGEEVDGASTCPSIDADGRYVVFESSATNLVDNDTNASKDVFIYDCRERIVERVSHSTSGTEGDGTSCDAAISADGLFVAFESSATNLVSDDLNGKNDIFVFDCDAATIERVSVSNAGVQGIVASDNPAISGDGRYVVFESDASNLVPRDTNGASDIFVFDRTAGTVIQMSMGADGALGDGDSTTPAISADGRHVCFASAAANLVSEDTNAANDIFVVGPLSSDDTDGDGILDDGDLSGITGDLACGDGMSVVCDDNCRATANPTQADTDGDGYGNACDCDLDNDGVVNRSDYVLFRAYYGSDEALADFDGDGSVGRSDYLILRGRWGTSAPFE